MHQRRIGIEGSCRYLDVHPAVAAAGCILRFLRFSSPDLNHIEHTFTELKARHRAEQLRDAGARDRLGSGHGYVGLSRPPGDLSSSRWMCRELAAGRSVNVPDSQFRVNQRRSTPQPTGSNNQSQWFKCDCKPQG